MKIEKITVKNFRCFGPQGTTIRLRSAVTAFVGANGSGKTAAFQALSRLFGLRSARCDGRISMSPLTSMNLSREQSYRSRLSSRFPSCKGLMKRMQRTRSRNSFCKWPLPLLALR